MKKDTLLIIIAVWVAVLPHLGFPPSWKKVLLFLTGLAIGFVAYSLRNIRIKKELAEESLNAVSEDQQAVKPLV